MTRSQRKGKQVAFNQVIFLSPINHCFALDGPEVHSKPDHFYFSLRIVPCSWAQCHLNYSVECKCVPAPVHEIQVQGLGRSLCSWENYFTLGAFPPRSINGYQQTVSVIMNIQWTSILSRKCSNTPSGFTLWKPGYPFCWFVRLILCIFYVYTSKALKQHNLS